MIQSTTKNPQLPSDVDLHLPSEALYYLLPSSLRTEYEVLKKLVDGFIEKNSQFNERSDIMLSMYDQLTLFGKGYTTDTYLKLLGIFIEYIRIKMLSHSKEVVHNAVLIEDGLIKNGDYRIYSVIGNHKNMKTLSKVARRYISETGVDDIALGYYILDVLQAWGEAFESHAEYYPTIPETYHRLKWKHNCTFLRPEYDHTRVPIFLPPLTKHQQQEIRRFNQYHGISTSAPRDYEMLPRAMPPIKPPRPTSLLPFVNNDTMVEVSSSDKHGIAQSRSVEKDDIIAEHLSIADTDSLPNSFASTSLLDYDDQPVPSVAAPHYQKTLVLPAKDKHSDSIANIMNAFDVPHQTRPPPVVNEVTPIIPPSAEEFSLTNTCSPNNMFGLVSQLSYKSAAGAVLSVDSPKKETFEVMEPTPMSPPLAVMVKPTPPQQTVEKQHDRIEEMKAFPPTLEIAPDTLQGRSIPVHQQENDSGYKLRPMADSDDSGPGLSHASIDLVQPNSYSEPIVESTATDIGDRKAEDVFNSRRKPARSSSGGIYDPSSDKNMEVRFYGTQRVLVKKSIVPKYF